MKHFPQYGKDVRATDQEQRIQAFNETSRPFYIVAHDDGTFSLCLPFSFLGGGYAGYGQEAFNRYAAEKGDPVMEHGRYTHGNGYEWEAAFRQAFADDPDIGRILFDCEAGGFFCGCDDLALLADFGRRFKEICEDTERFVPMIAEGIRNAEARQAEQERLMASVRGHLMACPQAVYEIETPEDSKKLLGGEMRDVKIGGAVFAACELLGQEVTASQTDLFDAGLIRMKTEEPAQEMVPSPKFLGGHSIKQEFADMDAAPDEKKDQQMGGMQL